MVVVITMLLMKKAPAQSILSGVIVGIVIAVFYQGYDTKFVFDSFFNGFNLELDNEFLTQLLNRGGMNSTVQAVIFTTGIGGMIKRIGVINVFVAKFSQKIKSVAGLVASAMSISFELLYQIGFIPEEDLPYFEEDHEVKVYNHKNELADPVNRFSN